MARKRRGAGGSSRTRIPREFDSGERGASILIALFYFLVCALVGGVVLTAATVATGQLVALEKSQQAYYSTTSAAELFRDAIEGGICKSDPGTGSTAGLLWTCDLPAQEGASSSSDAGNSVGTSDGAGKTLSAQLAKAVKTIADQPATSGSSPTVAQKDITLTFSSSAGGSNSTASNAVLPVKAKLTMRADYSIHITLTPASYSEDIGSYQVTCDIPAALLHSADGSTVERITWERAIISKPSTTTATAATTGGN